MVKKQPYRDRYHYRGLLFPPSAYTTCATVNIYKCTAEASDGFWGERTVERTDIELAEELRNWSIENRL